MITTCAPGETWLDALLRVAREGGCADKAAAEYMRLRYLGNSEREAAQDALKACGLADLADEVEARTC